MMPLDSDIAMTGQTDVGLGKVNLTTNGGKVLVEKVSARELHVNVAAGGTNLTMVSSSNLHVNAKAATVWKHSSNYAVW
jgi:pseudouridine-5'-phosphate glycosidase